MTTGRHTAPAPPSRTRSAPTTCGHLVRLLGLGAILLAIAGGGAALLLLLSIDLFTA